MIELSRRKFFGLLAAPAILRVTKPMALWSPAKPKRLTMIDWAELQDRTVYNMLASRGKELFLIGGIDSQYSDEFAKANYKIGSALQIRLPSDYRS